MKEADLWGPDTSAGDDMEKNMIKWLRILVLQRMTNAMVNLESLVIKKETSGFSSISYPTDKKRINEVKKKIEVVTATTEIHMIP